MNPMIKALGVVGQILVVGSVTAYGGWLAGVFVVGVLWTVNKWIETIALAMLAGWTGVRKTGA